MNLTHLLALRLLRGAGSTPSAVSLEILAVDVDISRTLLATVRVEQVRTIDVAIDQVVTQTVER